MPNDYIDLYFKAVDDDNKVMFAKMIESIKVIAVKDAQGKSVFSSESGDSQPAELVFAVPNDMFLLLKKADYINSNSIAIVPVPRNANYTENPSATQVASEIITDFILSKTAYIPDSTNSENTENNNNNNNNE